MMQAEEVKCPSHCCRGGLSTTQTDLSFVQSPKTPLQKSMDLLGKQLSLYSLSIIGETPVLRPLCLRVPVSPLCLQGSSCWWGGCRGRGSWTCSPSASGERSRSVPVDSSCP